MLRWTVRSLLAAPLQLAASAVGVGFAFTLVIFFEAVFAGESARIVDYLRRTDADVWVMQTGVANMHMATSFVQDWKIDKVAEVEGVAAVTPILYFNATVEAGGREWFSYVVGLEQGGARAGPWALAAGAPLPGPGEAVVPATLARMSGLGLGDEVRVADRVFSVVGLSEGTFSMANSIVFVPMSELADLMSAFAVVSYLLVDAAPGVDPAALAARIRAEVDKVNALPLAEFMANDHHMAMQMGVELIALMTMIGTSLAVLVVGFTVYSHTRRLSRELATAKALGVGNAAVYASVAVQATLLTALGLAVAVAVSYLAVPITAAAVPSLSLAITAGALARVGLAGLAVALVASLVPARGLVKLDPLLAMRG